ncbi:M1 family metallopeptidase [Brumimicrobium aurantiacum]|uniref:M1 family peptidase n=1 Tax=Brumimicrobium aurantiacum TaxID=1737063 RepID=A0A3E1F0S5_9FLAO|nr:M1 family metallopeptidase [Brumimicrobium aurantiacum]RFC55405.1 M1 family peptidase [Brumimicrobium aurantiacum]
MRNIITVVLAFSTLFVFGQGHVNPENINKNKFRQLKQELPTPNVYRTAAGAPGHEYYQQRANYKIEIELNDEKQSIEGKERITYENNSPDQLEYLWLQLDQNVRAMDSDSKLIRVERMEDFNTLSKVHKKMFEFDGGYKIESIKATNGEDMEYAINKTMLRIDLEEPLQPGKTISFDLKWWYNINDRMKIGGRAGYEYFPEDDNYLYTIAKFFPRMCVYNDVEGWQNKQFLGRGEFSLPFGDYDVKIKVPSDHVVTATGVLQNESQVLSSKQRERLAKAKEDFSKPTLIITQDEATENEKSRAKSKKTWHFEAENVRDFAFASSRKFIWDVMPVKIEDKTVLAMSLYPKEGNPLWEQYSTEVVAHTLEVYSDHTIPYPYPVAISVHAASIGMEYPMICFNFGRPEKDGTYSPRVKYGMMSVIIHEVGHNFFPMIINSDERQWTWMDEGLNTFLQYVAEQKWERNYPSRRGPAYMISDYMGGDKEFISPIMTNSESIWQFGDNAYGKPATALNILRETIMGRELFDYAFKVYATRWAFKHPTPADFFRTMEDASGVDLDWFWRGWFYSTDHVDISMTDVKWFQLNTGDPSIEKQWMKEQKESKSQFIGDIRNNADTNKTRLERKPELSDYYNEKDEYAIEPADRQDFDALQKNLSQKDIDLLNSGLHFYELNFENKGGLVMPLIIQAKFVDGTDKVIRIPAEIWRRHNYKTSKVLYFEKEVVGFTLDPFLETADTDLSNNSWPRKVEPTRFRLFQEQKMKENPMQRSKR